MEQTFRQIGAMNSLNYISTNQHLHVRIRMTWCLNLPLYTNNIAFFMLLKNGTYSQIVADYLGVYCTLLWFRFDTAVTLMQR